jgi:hypothetical protein
MHVRQQGRNGAASPERSLGNNFVMGSAGREQLVPDLLQTG